MDIDEFHRIRDEYLTAATPIRSPQHLKGRAKQLTILVDALRSPGRHAFIYGYRGVGKTSLAQTAAFQLQHSGRSPVIVSCDPTSTFASVMRDIISQIIHFDPTPIALATDAIKVAGVSDTMTYLRAICRKAPKERIFVIVDEFDQIADRAQHAYFANILKQVSDQDLPIRFIICGIADTLQALFSEHTSIFRQVHTCDVQRLELQARLDIVSDALSALNMTMDFGLKGRIAQISDGFPSFVHLIAEKVLTSTFQHGEFAVNDKCYHEGLDAAIESVELTLKDQYEGAVHSTNASIEIILWSIAAERHLHVDLQLIWDRYIRICLFLGETHILERDKLTALVLRLSKPGRRHVLQRYRVGTYTFQEKMMRAYARLRAARRGLDLGAENVFDSIMAPERKFLSKHNPFSSEENEIETDN